MVNHKEKALSPMADRRKGFIKVTSIDQGLEANHNKKVHYKRDCPDRKKRLQGKSNDSGVVKRLLLQRAMNM